MKYTVYNIKRRFSFTDFAHCVNLNLRLNDCNYNTTAIIILQRKYVTRKGTCTVLDVL